MRLPPQNPCADCNYRKRKPRVQGNKAIAIIGILKLLIVFGVAVYLAIAYMRASSQPMAPKSAYGKPPLVDIVNWVNENIYDCAYWYTDNSYTGINCVDYAILFWSYMGGKNNDNVRVMRCNNPVTGWDHLYIMYYGRAIEPTTGDDMKTWWGSEYKTLYERDITTVCRAVPLYPEEDE